jgi:hypothetical protein
MKKILLILILPLFLSSCATLFSGSKKPVQFNNNQDATILVNGNEVGTAPTVLKVKSEDIVTFEKDGFKSRTVIVDSKFNTISVLNLFNILFWGIDAISGAIKVPDTRVYNVTLKEEE